MQVGVEQLLNKKKNSSMFDAEKNCTPCISFVVCPTVAIESTEIKTDFYQFVSVVRQHSADKMKSLEKKSMYDLKVICI